MWIEGIGDEVIYALGAFMGMFVPMFIMIFRRYEDVCGLNVC